MSACLTLFWQNNNWWPKRKKIVFHVERISPFIMLSFVGTSSPYQQCICTNATDWTTVQNNRYAPLFSSCLNQMCRLCRLWLSFGLLTNIPEMKIWSVRGRTSGDDLKCDRQRSASGAPVALRHPSSTWPPAVGQYCWLEWLSLRLDHIEPHQADLYASTESNSMNIIALYRCYTLNATFLNERTVVEKTMLFLAYLKGVNTYGMS